MKNSYDLRFRFKDMAGYVVSSTEGTFTFHRILHFLRHCFTTLEVLVRWL